MKWNSRTRCALVCLGFILLFSGFSFRLIYLQMIKHDEYAGLAAEKHVIQAVDFRRARRRSSMQTTKCSRTTFRLRRSSPTRPVSTTLMPTVDLVSDELKIPRAEVSERLHGNRRYIVIKREVPQSECRFAPPKTTRAKSARRLFRARRDSHLSQRPHALSRDRVHRFRASRHPRRGRFDG